jgi:hypothetical protein
MESLWFKSSVIEIGGKRTAFGSIFKKRFPFFRALERYCFFREGIRKKEIIIASHLCPTF